MAISRKYLFLLGFIGILASCGGGQNPPSPTPTDKNLAFPGAEGGGKYATGGRGGMVCHVTTLTDDINDRGSLRYNLSLPGAKTIVFDISGTINLSRQLDITEGSFTLAGQTAPGDGICIAGFPVVVKASNGIIRFLRFRMGDQNAVEGDALSIDGRRDIIIDHCSFSWSTDECVSVYGNTNFTLQYCFISESLKNSVHAKGAHGYGGIWGGTNATFHHNLLAHHQSRNPRFDHDFVNTKCAGPIDYVNNVVYNWESNSAYGGEGTNKGAGGRHINFVANYYKPGPSTKSGVKARLLNPTTKCGDNCGKSPGGTVEPGKFYLINNVMDGSAEVTADNWAGVYPDESSKKDRCKATSRWTDGLIAITNEQTADQAYETVLAKAGCALKRDAIDTRIVNEVRNKSGKLVNSPDEAGGYPTLRSESAPLDTDHDGMPDVWEDEKGLDKNASSDGKLYTLDKNYTNLEVYLNSLVQDLF